MMICPSEAEEQALLFEWAAYYPELALMHHIPNGGSRHPAEAARLKRQGVKAGVSDIFLPIARGGYHGLYIELKRKGGRVSEAQREFITAAREQGYRAEVCYGADEAIRVIEGYMG